MKNYLKKYEMLWDVIEQIEWTPKTEYDDVQAIIIKSLTKEQSEQLMKEFTEIHEILSNRIPLNKLHKYTSGDEETNFTFIGNIIAQGYDKTIESLEEPELFFNNIPEKFTYNDFQSAIPMSFDYEEQENESVDKMFQESLNKVKMIKDAEHLSLEYKDNIEKIVLNFINKTKKALNGQDIGYTRDSFYEELKDFDEMSRWGRDVVAEVRAKEKKVRPSRSDGGNTIVGYGYPHAIDSYETNKKQENKNIDVSKYNKKYISDFSAKNVVSFLAAKDKKDISRKKEIKPK